MADELLYEKIEFEYFPKSVTHAYMVLQGPKELIPDGYNYQEFGTKKTFDYFTWLSNPDAAYRDDVLYCIGNRHINTDFDEGVAKLRNMGFSVEPFETQESYHDGKSQVWFSLSPYNEGSPNNAVLEDFVYEDSLLAYVYANDGTSQERSELYTIIDQNNFAVRGVFLPFAEDFGWSVPGKKMVGWGTARTGGTIYPEGYLYVTEEANVFPPLYAIWIDDETHYLDDGNAPVNVDSSGRTTSVLGDSN